MYVFAHLTQEIKLIGRQQKAAFFLHHSITTMNLYCSVIIRAKRTHANYYTFYLYRPVKLDARFNSSSRFVFFLHITAKATAVITAMPNAAPSPAAIGTVLFDLQLFTAGEAEVLVEKEPVNDAVPVIVLVYVTVAVGKIAVPAARRTVPLPDVQQALAASSWPQQK
jgi:hypothetical protein